jgi:hypothetical protein
MIKEYLFLFRGGDGKQLQQSPELWQQHMQKWMQWMAELSANGKFIGAQPLNETGKKISGSGKLISDGPFMDGKEMVGGYLMCKATNYEEAIDIAKECPILEFDDGVVEIREIQQLP